MFAPADLPTMKRAEADDLVAAPIRRYASNTMSVAVPPDNPAGIKGFADLAASDVTVVVCAPVVPCGAATQRVEQRSGITLTPASEESAVSRRAGQGEPAGSRRRGRLRHGCDGG